MYIHHTARDSYRHWWEQQTHHLWWYYSWQTFVSVQEEIHRLYPYLRPARPKRYRYRYTRTPWMRPWDVSMSGESSFRQAGYETKVHDDCATSRQDWREKKGFRRDHAKDCGKRHHNAGWYGKRIVHRSRRQHEREMIKHERYDELSQGVQDIVRCWWD